jgi:Cu-Zn family superoxide dismutase
MKKLAIATLTLLVPALLLSTWAGAEGEKAAKALHAVAVIHGGKSKARVHGVLHFVQLGLGHTVKISGELTGLKPGKHAFHIHEFGDCSDAKFMNTGGHYNPTHMKHGAPDAKERHVGDLGNIEADADGKAKVDISDTVISLTGHHSIVGRAVIVHEDPDDFGQPVGHAGGRVGCGVIGLAK